MAPHTSSGFPVLLGLAEVENYLLLEQLTTHPLLRNAAYAIIHFDSPDPRGIDVALLYQPDYFLPTQIKKYPLFLKNPKTQNRLYTRDQLLVSGLLAGEQITVSVNHWPSRRGDQYSFTDDCRPASATADRFALPYRPSGQNCGWVILTTTPTTRACCCFKLTQPIRRPFGP